jgi:hypothetical protein
MPSTLNTRLALRDMIVFGFFFFQVKMKMMFAMISHAHASAVDIISTAAIPACGVFFLGLSLVFFSFRKPRQQIMIVVQKRWQ